MCSTLTCRFDLFLCIHLPAESCWCWACDQQFLSHVQHVFLIKFQALWERKCAFPSAGMCWSLQTGISQNLSCTAVFPWLTSVTQRNKVASVVPTVKGNRKIEINQPLMRLMARLGSSVLHLHICSFIDKVLAFVCQKYVPVRHLRHCVLPPTVCPLILIGCCSETFPPATRDEINKLPFT